MAGKRVHVVIRVGARARDATRRPLGARFPGDRRMERVLGIARVTANVRSTRA